MSPPGQDSPSSGARLLTLGGWLVAAVAVAFLLRTRFQTATPATLPPLPEVAPSLATPAAVPADPSRGAVPVRAEAAVAIPDLEEIVARGMASVVVVETPRGKGSAFFVRAGTLLTNAHVVTGCSYVTIRKAGGETGTAYVGATAADYDLAVLTTSGSAANKVHLDLGTAGALRPGQEVLAIGAPLGLQNTVTRGIVSSLRQMGPVSVIQTDTAINPGNSGGPLLDRQGRVVGITSFIITSGTQPGAVAASQGLNFAVAIDHAKALLEGRSPAEGAQALQQPGNLIAPRTTPSDTENQQLQGLRTYEVRLAQLAAYAEALDQAWARLLAAGYQGQAPGTLEHGWFSVYERPDPPDAVLRGYEAAYKPIRAAAEDLKSKALAADEAARQAGVLPGARRELRQKYRLDYGGWGL